MGIGLRYQAALGTTFHLKVTIGEGPGVKFAIGGLWV
jgi:hypothetical protein